MHVTIGKQVWGECCLLRGAHSKWMSTNREQLELMQPVLQSEARTHGELLHVLWLCRSDWSITTAGITSSLEVMLSKPSVSMCLFLLRSQCLCCFSEGNWWKRYHTSTTLQVRLIDYNSRYYLLPGGNAEQAKCVRVSVAPTKSVSLLL